MGSTSLLLLRSSTENAKIAKILAPKQIDCISYPIMSHTPSPSINWTRILQNYSDIIITSKYAAEIYTTAISNYYEDSQRNHKQNTQSTKQANLNYTNCNSDNMLNQTHKKFNLWLVGNASEQIISSRAISYQTLAFDIKHVAQNASELITYMIAWHNQIAPQDLMSQKFVYLSGNIITSEMPSFVDRIVVYKTQYLKSLEENFYNIIKNINYVFLYSKNSATIFTNLLREYNIAYGNNRYNITNAKSIKAICMSQAISDLATNFFTCSMHAQYPNTASMIDILLNDLLTTDMNYF